MVSASYGRGMRYRVLGPVRIERDGEEIPLGGPQQRLVLALLIAARGRVVSSGGLIESMWGEDAPPTAKKTIQGYISKLRAELGEALATQGSGYSLDTKGAVDAIEFEELQRRGQQLLGVEPAGAATVFCEALALWDGPAYEDLADHLALAPEIARLEDQRVAVLGDRIDADLACGSHRGLIGELEGLTQEFPLQDRFRAQHMIALYRAGRQVEALRSFERTRRFLAEEMGLEPSAELRELEQQILSSDESLNLQAEVESNGRSAVRGYELREIVGTAESTEVWRAYQRSVGREVTVQVLGAGIADDPHFIADFVTDTQRVAALEHPHIGFVFDTWREPGRAYQVSRWFSAGSLADRMEREKLSASSGLRILDHVGGALGYAHRRGVPHGNVEAANVMFDEEANAYLTGFLVGRNGDASPADDRRDFARLAATVLGEAQSAAVDAVVDVALEPDAGYARVEDFLRALHQATGTEAAAPEVSGTPSMTEIRNPFKGLRAFQEVDADDFFGREDLVERLITTLDSNRLVAVVGPSGSGKSSAVKAGLSARIRSDEGGPIRLQTEMFPGAFPFEELEGALLRVGVNRDSVISELLSDDRGLLRVLKQILPADDAQLLLVIDQFEELFSLATDHKVTQLFLDSILNAVADPRSRLRVVITMRADFYDRPLQHPEFGALMEAGLVSVTMPDRDGLAAAIAQPALAVGLDFEPGLVDRIVRDLEEQPGGLPLLQYAMTELVEQRTSDLLTFAAYESIGGVYGALGRRAEDLYNSLGPTGQHAIHQAFLRMVTVDEGAKDLRRRVSRAELAATDVDHGALSEALQLYGAHRLITFDRDPSTRASTVEVAHEALTREWDRLEEWITDERDDLVVRRRLDEALAEWKDAGQDPSYLPSGSRLAQFEEWADSTSLSMSTQEREFLDAGTERVAELTRRAASRRRGLLVGLAAIAAVMTLLAGFALLQQREADDAAAEAKANADRADANAVAAETNADLASSNADRADANAAEAVEAAYVAETGRLASEAAARATTNPVQALLLARAAYERAPGTGTLGALQRVMLRADPLLRVLGEPGRRYIGAKWSDPRGVLVLLHTDGVEVYDSESLELLHDVSISVATEQAPLDARWESPVFAFDVSTPDGVAAVGTDPNTVVLIDLESYELTMIAQDSPVTAVALSGDSTSVAVSTTSGSVEIWSVGDAQLVAATGGHPEQNPSTAFAAELLAAGVAPEYLWTTGSVRSVSALAFSSDGSLLASASSPVVRVWDVRSGELRSEILPVHEGYVLAANDFVGTGPLPFLFREIEVLESDPWVVRLSHADRLADYDLQTGERVAHIEVPTDSSNLSTVITGHAALSSGLPVVALSDGRIRTLDADGNAISTYESILAMPGQVDVSPDGAWLALTGDGGVLVLSLDGTTMLAESTPLHTTGLLSVTADGRLIDQSDFGGSTVLQWSGSGYEARSVPPAISSALSGVFSAGGDDFMVGFGFTDDSAAGPAGLEASAYRIADDGSDEFLGRFFWDFQSGAGSPDDEWMATSLHSEIVIRDVETFAEIERLSDLFGDDGVGSISVSADGSRLLAATRAGEIGMWTTSTWERLDPPVELAGTVAVSYSPDGRHLATVASDGTIALRDPISMVMLRSLVGSGSADSSGLAWTLDGRFLLSTFDHRSARLWDVESGTQIGDPFPNNASQSAATATSEVLPLVTTTTEAVRVWNLDTSTWPDLACRVAGRNMTKAEWDQFGPRDTDYRATCPQYGIEG